MIDQGAREPPFKNSSIGFHEFRELAKGSRRDSSLPVYFQGLGYGARIAQPRKNVSKNKPKEHNMRDWGMNQLQSIKANITHLLLVLTLTVTAGDMISAAEQPKSASQATADAINTSTANYPWSDKVDFENATRGFIASLSDEGEIKNAAGKDIWNIAAYQSFIKEGSQSPSTVNPSLWRISQLLMYSGLFEVVPGVRSQRRLVNSGRPA
jgi:hypothetical protein